MARIPVIGGSLLILLLLAVSLPAQQGAAGVISRGTFAFAYDERGISQLRNPCRSVWRHGDDPGSRRTRGCRRRGKRGASGRDARTRAQLQDRRRRKMDRRDRARKDDRVAGDRNRYVRRWWTRDPGRTRPRGRRNLSHGRRVAGLDDRSHGRPRAGDDWRSRDQHPRAGTDGRESRADLRARISQASVHLRRRLVLLLHARVRRAAVSRWS